MAKKQKTSPLDSLIDFMTDRIKTPTKKELDKLMKKSEQTLLSLKIPTRRDLEQLTKRVEALEKALKVKKPRKSAVKKAGTKTGTKKKPAPRHKPQVANSERVLRAIKREQTGVNVATLKTRTGLEDKAIRNILSKLSKQGKIKRAGRGVYKAAV